MELLLLIFVLTLIFNIIPKFLPHISRIIADFIKPETPKEISLKKEMRELSALLKETNMVNEFATYARTERKINKMKEELKQIGKSRSAASVTTKAAINAILYTIQVLVYLGLIYSNRSTPVIELPPNWLWPMEKLLAFPTGIPGAVSVTVWIVACRSVVPRILALVMR